MLLATEAMMWLVPKEMSRVQAWSFKVLFNPVHVDQQKKLWRPVERTFFLGLLCPQGLKFLVRHKSSEGHHKYVSKDLFTRPLITQLLLTSSDLSVGLGNHGNGGCSLCITTGNSKDR